MSSRRGGAAEAQRAAGVVKAMGATLGVAAACRQR